MNNDPWAEFRIQPQQSQPQGDPWAEFRVKAKEPVGVLEDVAKTVPAGLARGAAALAGTPGMLDQGLGWLGRQTVGRVENAIRQGSVWGLGNVAPEYDEATKRAEQSWQEHDKRVQSVIGFAPPRAEQVLEPQNLVHGIEGVAGELYRPQTTGGQFANTIAEFAPAAVIGGGTALQRAGQVVFPALSSEGAGQVAKQVAPQYETAARIAGGVGGGIGTAVAQIPRGANAVAREAMQGISRAEAEQAGALMVQALEGPNPVRLSFDEALNQVTSGRASRLQQVRRVAENSDGGQALQQMTAARPAEIKAAGQAAVDSISPNPYTADIAAMRGQQAAQGVLDDTMSGINQATRPFYQQAEQHVLNSADFAPIARDPAFQHSLRRLRNDPVLGPRYAELPDSSLAVIDAVTKDMTARGQAAANTANPGFNPERGVAFNSGAAEARDIARTVERGGSEAYDTALQMQKQARRDIYEPLEAGPIGRIAKVDPAAENASASMGRIMAGAAEGDRYHSVIQQSVRRIVKKDPRAAETIARDYISDVFNQSVADLQGGGNPYGAANFRKMLIGTPAQEKNLEAMISQLPGGQQRMEGFRKFLDIAEATGYKPPKGSDTAFNAAIQDRFRETGVVRGAAEGAVQAAVGGGVGRMSGLRRAFTDRLDRYRMGQNVEQFADLLTDPKYIELWRNIASSPVGSNKALWHATRALVLAERSANNTNAAGK